MPMSLRFLLRGQMAYMRSKGFEVLMASANGPEVMEVMSHEGARHLAVALTRKITPITDIKAIFQLVRLIKKEKIDIVHSHTPKAGLIAMLAAKLANAPHRLHTIAGIPWMERRGATRKLLKLVDKVAYMAATKVYSNSYGLLDFVKSEELVKSSKLSIIGAGSTNGIDVDYFKPKSVLKSKEELRAEMELLSSDFIFCFVGRVVNDKGMTELAIAMKQMPKHVKLLLIGPFEDDLDPIASETKDFFETDPRVSVCGYQSDIRPYLKMSDALVFPSYREGFPNVPMQGGAMGLPIIATDINGCNEIVQNEVNGLLVEVKNAVELTNAMKKIYEDKDFYMHLSSRSRQMIIERFDQKVVWEALYAEYIALAEKKPNV